MRHFIIFYTKHQRLDGSIFWSEKLGSDGIAYLDNRFGRARQHAEAHRIGATRRAFHVDGYRIARGQDLSRLFFLTAEVQSL